jgi:hypothetical protein
MNGCRFRFFEVQRSRLERKRLALERKRLALQSVARETMQQPGRLRSSHNPVASL